MFKNRKCCWTRTGHVCGSPLCFGSCCPLCLEHLPPAAIQPTFVDLAPCPRKMSSTQTRDTPPLLNSHRLLLSWIAFIRLFIVLWMIMHSFYQTFTQFSICFMVVLGCWGYNGEQTLDLSLFPTANFMPMNQILSLVFRAFISVAHS